METESYLFGEILKLTAERDALLAKVAELENLLAEANESLNDTRVWL